MSNSSNRFDGPSYPNYSNASSVADDEDNKDGDGNSKRQRVHFSCTECHRRKQKCNRQTPCQHCIARKIPERCKTFQPGEDPADLLGRVTRMEKTMQENFQKMFGMMKHFSSGIVDSTQIQQVQAEAAGSEAGDEVLGESHSPKTIQYSPSKQVSMKIDNLLDTFSGAQSAGDFTDPTRLIEGATDLDALMYEYGATESITQALLSIFPSRELADALMDHFFSDINWLRQPMSQRRTRVIYDEFWASGPKLTANNINCYACLVILMATAICSIEQCSLLPEDPRAIRLMARRLFYAGRRALLASTMLGREDLQQVMGYSLASRYLLLDRRITEAWTCVSNAVKTAHSIGLHRDGTKLHLSKTETDVRRRTWSFVYFTDRNLCMNLGRPTQIDDNVVDTLPPNEDDDLDIFPEMFAPALPLKNNAGPAPSPLSYTMHRHRLAVIMGKIISTYQNLHSPAHYGDIISIDKELEQHRRDLPTYFRSDINKRGDLFHVDTSWDDELPFVPIHRYLLESEIDHIRVSLHRPYLLRTSNKAGHRYDYSRRSCIAAAHRNILLRRDIIGQLQMKFGYNNVPKAYHLHLGTYKTLNSLIIIGMYLLVTPQAEDAEMLLGHLRYYSEVLTKKRATKSYIRDDMKDREASIINLFLQRIEETRAEAAKGGDRKLGKSHKRGSEESNLGNGKRSKKSQDGLSQDKSNGQTIKTSDEDTAGVLLDLNQSGGKTKSSPTTTYNELASPWKKPERKGSGEKVMAPWPYLPSNTHRNTASLPSHHSNGNGPSPATDSIHSDDNLGASNSAQQLFESWFRYNAFETMDLDSLNLSSSDMDQMKSQQQQQQQSLDSSFDAASVSFPIGGGGGGGSSVDTLPGQDISRERQTSSGTPYSVQLSTLPAPVWNSTPASGAKPSNLNPSASTSTTASSSLTSNQLSKSSSAPDSNSTSSVVGMAGFNPNNSNIMSTFPTISGAANMASTNVDQFNDASFDPNFWQR